MSRAVRSIPAPARAQHPTAPQLHTATAGVMPVAGYLLLDAGLVLAFGIALATLTITMVLA